MKTLIFTVLVLVTSFAAFADSEKVVFKNIEGVIFECALGLKAIPNRGFRATEIKRVTSGDKIVYEIYIDGSLNTTCDYVIRG
jgi:hypothetical protein